MTAAKPARMRGRDRRAVRKAEARFAEQLERGTEAPAPVPQPAAPRKRPSVATLVRESVKAIDAERSALPRVVGAGLTSERFRPRAVSAAPARRSARRSESVGVKLCLPSAW